MSENTVPCPCTDCKGKQVSRYTRRKHTRRFMPKIPSGVTVEQSSRKHHVPSSLRGVSETSFRTQKCVALNFNQPQPVLSRLDDSNSSLPLGEYDHDQLLDDYEEADTDIVSSKMALV